MKNPKQHLELTENEQVQQPNILKCQILTFHFYRASYACAVYAMALCLSVRPSVTSRCSTKMAKHRNMQTTPHDRPGTLVF